jgi:ABC-type transport system involved in multi-copper enzyme maturation permease subunit
MLGSVLWLELRRAGRRSQYHRLRGFIAVALAAEAAVFLVLCWSMAHPFLTLGGAPPPTAAVVGEFLASGLEWLLVQQLVLVVLAAPVLAAGSIGDEKIAGRLQDLLATPLESHHIIAGKWLAAMLQAACLVLPAVPLVLLLAAHVGLRWCDQAALVLLPLVPMPGLVAAGLLAAVWTRHTVSAVVRLYTVLAILGLTAWLTGVEGLDPVGVISGCLTGDGSAWGEMARMALVWGCPVVPCLVVASWRLRPACSKQLEARPAAGGGFLLRPRPPVGTQPLRWKERFLGERSLLPLPRFLTGPGGLLLVGALTLLVYGGLALDSWRWGPGRADSWVVLSIGVGVMALAGLLVAVRAAGCISGERERRTWEPLLLTPLEPRQLLRGKLWGVLDAARPYLLAYLLAAVLPVGLVGIGALGWLALTWLGTWIVLYFAAATGMECSVRAGSSWRALLRALLSSSWVALVRFMTYGVPAGFLLSFAAGAVTIIVLPRLLSVGTFVFPSAFALGSLGATVAVLLAQAEATLEMAEKHVRRNERIPQDGPRHPLEAPGAARRGAALRSGV